VPARILDGKALAKTLCREAAERAANLTAQLGRPPGLTAVLVGDNPASQVYVRNKETACQTAGIAGTVLRLAGDISQYELLETVDRLNADDAVDGILVQLPLPRQIDDRLIIERIDPRKDVDGFHPENVGLLTIGTPRFIPCTPLGIRTMLSSAGISTRGTHVVVLGRSNIVGKPMALLLLQKAAGGDATVTVCHTATRDAASLTRQADMVIAAVGRAEHVTGEWVKPGAVVIDVGMNRRADGRLCGDVHFPSASEVAGWISPVPGGVGRMTVAMLLHNTLDAARLRLAGAVGP
jgi:methylenetetrahydrofolate dehydrogenase (NADP+)/methenyltetrahydrofolate cyclohydrolase